MYEERVDRAVELFKQGFNCSQSVVGAFADLYGFTFEQALHMAASFGGGIGRMRETCGAACGLFMLAGLEVAATKGEDKQTKAANYQLVQSLADKLKQKNGSIICGVLLGLKKSENVHFDPATISTIPEERTEKYYKKRPCVELVRQSAQIWADYLNDRPK